VASIGRRKTPVFRWAMVPCTRGALAGPSGPCGRRQTAPTPHPSLISMSFSVMAGLVQAINVVQLLANRRLPTWMIGTSPDKPGHDGVWEEFTVSFNPPETYNRVYYGVE
jgi:hypothetical protein